MDGLTNLTYSRCYVNVIMQFFFHNPYLFQKIQQHSEYGEFCHDKELLTTKLHCNYCKYKGLQLGDQDVSSDFLHWCLDLFSASPSTYKWNMTQKRRCVECNAQNTQKIEQTMLQIYPTKDTLTEAFIDSLLYEVDFRCGFCENNPANKAVISNRFDTFPTDLFIAVNQTKQHKLQADTEIEIADQTYNLMGCVEHTGCLDGGHYRVYCKLGSDWYCYNDEKVSTIKNKTMLTKLNGKSNLVCFWYQLID